jgi:hypothetical protein
MIDNVPAPKSAANIDQGHAAKAPTVADMVAKPISGIVSSAGGT